MKTRTLSDNTASIKITGIPSSFNTTKISVATQHDPRYVEILRRYKHLTQPIKPTDAGDHQTQHHIKTTGQPAYSWPRRLPPHKLAYAKKAFEESLADNIIRPSDSPYASPLHLSQTSFSGKISTGDRTRLNTPRTLTCLNNHAIATVTTESSRPSPAADGTQHQQQHLFKQSRTNNLCSLSIHRLQIKTRFLSSTMDHLRLSSFFAIAISLPFVSPF
ncbi:unnamed protein product [Acanthosepion pharaonis]|uniref:Uncharacterized protein n=1 Tax=Acanthosepion pharaonis TaxID=158019 RepID=A0A812DAZ7_ACAPH|nr:unnamed protein product [Sepia pharaonis]